MPFITITNLNDSIKVEYGTPYNKNIKFNKGSIELYWDETKDFVAIIDSGSSTYKPQSLSITYSDVYGFNNSQELFEFLYNCIENYVVGAPTNLVASTMLDTQIQLTWDDNSTEEGFKLERSDNGGINYNVIYTSTTNIQSYLDTGLVANTTYYYRIRAFDGYRYSNYSNVSTATTLTDKFAFIGWYSEISGGFMPNKLGIDSATVTGAVGAEVYELPATYKTADTDYCWWKTDGSLSTTTTARLVTYDFARTIVKYSNTAPYAIDWIGILEAGAVLTTAEENVMRDVFQLSRWWSGVLSVHGNTKGNRGSGQSVWVPESTAEPETLALIARYTTPATAGLKAALDKFIKGLKTDGLWTGIDCLQIYELLAADQIVCNFKGNYWNATLVNSPVFTPKVGVKSNPGLTGFIDTGFVPSAGVQFTQNDCGETIGNVNIPSPTLFEGVYDSVVGSEVIHKHNGDILCVNALNNADAIPLQIGWNIISRPNSTTHDVYNGAWNNSKTSIGTPPPDCSPYVCAYNNTGVVNAASISLNESKGRIYHKYFTNAQGNMLLARLATLDADIAAL